MSEKFETFMARREAAARAFVTGDAEPVVALSTETGTATFFDPGGGFTEGAAAIDAGNREGAASFAPGGATRFEIKDHGASGDLAFWTGYQVAEVVLADGKKRVPMRLRVTEVFRREEGGWRMVHRHASMAKDERG
ncbi:MAG: nuclear transport factor 2 family protein [Myxococcales bacterium]|nr:nuclear transport factor 2 family protein [Myxococcales bacterium]MCB9732750.1 nuclear transport factor 2 family protein [Deltaproteobacteria bacterium]